MIAAGVLELAVIKKPVVGIIPSGDEIIQPCSDPKPGDILEFNSSIFSAMLAIAPGLAIVVVVVSLNIFSDGLHQYFEPVQRKLPSFKKYDRMEAKARAEREREAAKHEHAA